jgi:hypothetical protein
MMTVSVSRWLTTRLQPSLRLFAALAVVGIVLGTATLTATPANAAFPSFGFQGDNQGSGS